jgi:hypothetical protein
MTILLDIFPAWFVNLFVVAAFAGWFYAGWDIRGQREAKKRADDAQRKAQP